MAARLLAASIVVSTVSHESPKLSILQPLATSLISVPSTNSVSLRCRLAARPRSSWRPQVYTYPDPIPEFATAETQKFGVELRRKLMKSKEDFDDDVDEVVMVCIEIFSKFLHTEYGGPGTLLVEPFTDMLRALKEKKLPGAPVAARAAILWAQNYVDHDWDIWTSQHSQ